MKPADPLLQLDSISKAFVGVQALSDVSFNLDQGEIVAVVGENGAGKSTLMKILAGVHPADRGQVLLEGRPLRPKVRDAMQRGVRLIHQELTLAEDLTAAENIYLGREPRYGPRWMPVVDRRRMRAGATQVMESIGLDTSPDTSVRSLSIAQRQLVEIAKALSSQVRVLILDEPTSSLAVTEADRLLSLVEQLRAQGVAILYVSHHLREVARLADRVVVLRDGRHVGTLSDNEITPSRMVPLMIGRDIERFSERKLFTKSSGPPALEAHNLTTINSTQPISLRIEGGEVVGIAGLVGAGRTEVAKALFGIDQHRSGEVHIHGHRVKINNPADAIRAGLALVPEDRQKQGVLISMSVSANICLAALGRMAKFGCVFQKSLDRFATGLVSQLGVRLNHVGQSVAGLSGGNQQKVVLAKWLAMKPTVLILDEPTRGVDISARFDVYRLIMALVAQGMAVMMISSDMEEVVAMSDRVIVMKDGHIAGELVHGQINEANIMQLALGQRPLKLEGSNA